MTDFRNTPTAKSPGAKVTPLFTRPAGPDEAGLRALVAYWTALSARHPVPLRRDVDPRRIDGLLPNTFILESVAPGLARFRVAGTRLADLMGMDVRGMPISTLIEPGSRDAFADALAGVFDRPSRLWLQLRAAGGFGRPPLTGAMAVLPLRCDRGEVSRALGAIVTDAPPGRAPRRFAVSRYQADPVSAAVDETAPPAPLPRPSLPGGGSHLRLVVSN